VNEPSTPSGGARRLRAGVATRDITTDAAGVVVKDRLFAKALVVSDGATTLVIVAMDVTAIGGRAISQGLLPDVSEDFLPTLRARVEAELGIAGANVMVNASHTHPPGRMLCDDAAQLDRTFDAIRRAAAGMIDVRVGSGVGREDRISINRTLRLKDGRNWTIRHANSCPPDRDVERVGPVDADIGILRFDWLDGRPLAVLYNFACHLLWGDPHNQVSANFPGVASRVIEESLGGDVTAIFLQGAAGDVVDVEFKSFERPRDVEAFGNMLGLSALRAIREIETGPADLGIAAAELALPRRNDIPERVAELRRHQETLLDGIRSTSLNFEGFVPLYLKYLLRPESPIDYSYRYLQSAAIGSDAFTAMDAVNRRNVEKYLQNIRAMEELARVRENLATLEKHQQLNDASGSPTVHAAVQAVRIGDCVIVAAPLEVLTEVGLNVKRESRFAKTFIAGFSNGYLHYGPPADAYSRGGYEVTECLLAPEWQAIFERGVSDAIGKL
jgi:hypothetical protein